METSPDIVGIFVEADAVGGDTALVKIKNLTSIKSLDALRMPIPFLVHKSFKEPGAADVIFKVAVAGNDINYRGDLIKEGLVISKYKNLEKVLKSL